MAEKEERKEKEVEARPRVGDDGGALVHETWWGSVDWHGCLIGQTGERHWRRARGIRQQLGKLSCGRWGLANGPWNLFHFGQCWFQSMKRIYPLAQGRLIAFVTWPERGY